ncbi:MAG: hypothetical protein WKF58_11655 [Ilumatobacteraceae bacterium]
MSEDERMAYSRHETSALLGAGIWFERADADRAVAPPRDPGHRSDAPLPPRRGGRRVPSLDDVRRVHPPLGHARVRARSPGHDRRVRRWQGAVVPARARHRGVPRLRQPPHDA